MMFVCKKETEGNQMSLFDKGYGGYRRESGIPDFMLVTKMRFAKKEHPVDENKNGKLDRRELEDWSRIIYNDRVTIRGIPLAADA